MLCHAREKAAIHRPQGVARCGSSRVEIRRFAKFSAKRAAFWTPRLPSRSANRGRFRRYHLEVTPAAARLLAACGALAPVIFTTAWVVAGVVQDGYSARREDISALAARSAGHPWLMIAALVTTGLLIAAFALALDRGVRRGSVAGPALVAICGLGMVALGLLRNDCSSLTVECEARIDAGEVSWQHTAHDLVSAPVIAAAVAAPLVLALRFRADVSWRSLAPYSAAAAPALAALFALGGLELAPTWNGVLQRVAVSVALLWLEVAALHLLRLPTADPRST
jgi:hypothetical protein